MPKNRLRKIYFGIFWAVLIASFVVFATLLIFVANGYYFNLKTFKLQKTGMIVLRGSNGGIAIIVNGKKSQNSFPIKLRRLIPGRYDIKIEKEGYQSWERVFQLEGGQAIVKNNINLFLTNPSIKEKSKNADDILTLKNNYKERTKNITLKGSEIWVNNKLVTRYSQPILAAFLDPDEDHLYVQIGDLIRVIETEGTNDFVLIKLNGSLPTYFSVTSSKLTYLQDETIFEATIR